METWRETCKELPEEGDRVLVTIRQEISMAVIVGYSKNGSPIWISVGGGYHIRPSLISAWMPLPTPWKPEREVKE